MFFFFFFKQKTAYEMRISDWSSDVCSSDLIAFLLRPFAQVAVSELRKRCAHPVDAGYGGERVIDSGRQGAQRDLDQLGDQELQVQIGRASCRERGCQYV